jgi:Spy/CpxP family protein refolding chaperone
MTFRKTGIFMVGMLMFLYPVVARAERDQAPVRWWRIPELAGRLDLNGQEKQTLEKLFVENRKVLLELRSKVEKQRLELEDVLEKPDLDQRAAFDQFKQLEKMRQKLSAERFRYLLEVRKILGRDRYLKLMDMAKERHERKARPGEDDLSPR